MQILGLCIDRPFLRLAFLEKKGKLVEIRSIKTIQFNSTDDVKQFYMSASSANTATVVPALIRHLDFKISSIPQIEQGLPFQIESLTHLLAEEICYTSQIVPDKKGAKATVYFIPKSTLNSHLEAWKTFSIEPDFVTAQAQAMISFANFRSPNLKSAFLVHLGSQEWTCVWMENGVIERSFSIPMGMESLLSALWEDRKKVLFQKEIEGVAKQIDLLELKPLFNPQLSQQLETQKQALANVLFSFQQIAGVRPIFFTGRLQTFGRLPEYLTGALPALPIHIPQIPISPEEYQNALALGAGLELAADRRDPIQFLKGEFIPRKAWRRVGAWSISLIVISMALSMLLFELGRTEFHKTKSIMADSLKELIDSKVAKNAFSKGLDHGIDHTLDLIEKNDKEAPYLLTVPTVSEFLSWLSSHPILSSFEAAGDPLEIVNVRYQLVSFPKIGAMKDPYTAKVELEFRIKSPMNARKFHETLLAGDELIDLGTEITWESLADSYRTSFTLVQRIPHVP